MSVEPESAELTCLIQRGELAMCTSGGSVQFVESRSRDCSRLDVEGEFAQVLLKESSADRGAWMES